MKDKLELELGFNDLPDIKCDKCASMYFRQAVRLKRISKLLSGQEEDGIQAFPVFVCVKCGHVNSEFEYKDEEKSKLEI